MENNREYNIYKTSKNNIQLTHALLENIETTKHYELSGTTESEIQFATRVEIIDKKKGQGFLKTKVATFNKGEEHPGLIINIVYKGIFETPEEIEESKFESWIDLQLVPQLLPYTRVLVSNISTLIYLQPINLPTIDVLETLKTNDHSHVEME